nr:immunoglobulin light chain junction region [Macaca mulatta]
DYFCAIYHNSAYIF